MIRFFICFICALVFHLFLLKFEIPQYSKPQKTPQIRRLEIQLQEVKYIQEVTKKEELNPPLKFNESIPKIVSTRPPERKSKEALSRKKEESVKEAGESATENEPKLIQADQPNEGADLALGWALSGGTNTKEGGEVLGAVNPRPLEEYTPPQYGHNPPPKYPKAARKAGYQGKVLLEVLVTREGSPKEIKVRESSGYKVLDEAAVEAVQKWKFVPAKRGEVFLEEWVWVPIRFSLEESIND